MAWIHKKGSAFKYDPNIIYDADKLVIIGRMDTVCHHCNALKWKEEPTSLCCLNGKIKLDPIAEPPRALIQFVDPKSSPIVSLFKSY